MSGSFGQCHHCQLCRRRRSIQCLNIQPFFHLDTDHDGLLSYAEMLKKLQSLRVFETPFGVDVNTDPDELARVYDSLFVQFDHDMNGTADSEELKTETKQIMLAMANGMVFLPLQMVLEEDGKQIMLAMANGMGLLPVQMVLDEDSFLTKAVERESTKVCA